MFLSVALPTDKTTHKSHATLNIYNTGDCISATGLAVSSDLDHWAWQGVVFRPEKGGWDCYCRRINCVLPVNGDFLAFYDGSASHEENYEEKTGVAISNSLRHWKSLSMKGPAFISPHGSHSLRYVDAMLSDRKALVFYECARPDGAHDLRLLTMDQTELQSSFKRLWPDEFPSA